MEFLYVLLGILIGGLVVALFFIFRMDKPMGSLYVDMTDPNSKPLLYLVPNAEPDVIAKEKHISLTVRIVSPK